MRKRLNTNKIDVNGKTVNIGIKQEGVVRKIILAVVITFLFSALNVQAQDFCKGDFTYDGDVDSEDVTTFLEHFGRGEYSNPCPPNGPTQVAKTGQTTSYATGDDGDLQRGVALVTPRFTDNLDGTATDNQTGLIWMKDANCFGAREWNNALSDCNGLASDSCGLTDGSNAGDWILPNRSEFQSLIDVSNYNPSLPSGHPFYNVVNAWYWSSNTLLDPFNDVAYFAHMMWGEVSGTYKSSTFYVWCVRGGH